MTDIVAWGSPRGPGNRSWVDTDQLRPIGAALPYASGGDLRSVRRIASSFGDSVFALAGTRLVVIRSDGSTSWSRGDLGVTRVVEVLPSLDAVIVVGGRDHVLLVSLADGDVLWSWRHPDGCDVTGAGSLRVFEHSGRPLLLAAPGYSTTISCFEMDAEPRLRWTQELGDRIDAGFGPVMVAADIQDFGKPKLIISSRTGSGYGTDSPTTERIVLGREDGRLYQAVLDLDDGALLAETAYEPEPGGYPAARPYGLLQAGASAGGDIVLASCQVEEYVAVTATDGSLRRRWGWFVEKDWPTDRQELRPQTTSVSDVMGDGRPRLTVGHWDGATWSTRVFDVLGPDSDESSAAFEGRYFWGSADLDGDGIPELITSVEPNRRPSERTRLEILDARTGETIATLDEVTVVTVDDDPLPADRVFHGEHKGAATIVDGAGRTGLLLIDTLGRTVWLHLGDSRIPDLHVLLDQPVSRVEATTAGVALCNSRGAVVLLDRELRTETTMLVEGRASRPLIRSTSTGAEIIADTAGGHLVGIRNGRAAWSIRGDHSAIHSDGRGHDLLISVAAGSASSTVGVWSLDGPKPAVLQTWDVSGSVEGVLVFGAPPIVLALRRVGPHTANLIAFDQEGRELWRDDDRGVHASDPLAFVDGVWKVATDDHGVLTVRDGETGAVLSQRDWTASYTTPIAVNLDGLPLLLRADGAHGVELCALTGESIWRRSYELFTIHPGVSVVIERGEHPVLAVPRKGGMIDVLSLRDGELLNELSFGLQLDRRPLLGVGPELLIGTLAGDLIAVEPVSGAELWRERYASAIAHLAAVAAPDRASVAVSTADGGVHLLELGSL